MSITVSPVPIKSKITDKEGLVLLDWVRWFGDISYYVTRILNRYDVRKAGVATLVAGSVVIVNTNVLATSYIRLTAQNVGGTAGTLSVTLSAGVGFTLTSSNALDTRAIFYEIVEAF